tara:strand:- start:988 stop:1209 length:222 start_codon:yes stop_codon:yes gene_type:complete
VNSNTCNESDIQNLSTIAKLVWLTNNQVAVLPSVIDRMALSVGMTSSEFAAKAVSKFDLALYVGQVCRKVAAK